MVGNTKKPSKIESFFVARTTVGLRPPCLVKVSTKEWVMSSAGGPEGNRTPASYLDRVAVRPRTGPQVQFKFSRILKLAKRKFESFFLVAFKRQLRLIGGRAL